MSLQTKLLAVLGVVLLLTILVGAIGIFQAGRINDASAGMYADDLLGASRAATLAQDISTVRGDVLQHALTTNQAQRIALIADITRLDRSIGSTIDAIRSGNPDGDLGPSLDAFTLAWRQYSQTRDNTTPAAGQTGNTRQALIDFQGARQQGYAAVSDALSALIARLRTAAAGTNAGNTSTFDNARTLIVITTVLSILIGLGLSLFLARRIGGSVRQVARASESLARGELSSQITVRSNDEIGQMAGAFQQMTTYQRAMSAAAEAIARGDLSAEVTPQSERDVLGNAFQRMIGALRRMAGVADAIARGDLSAEVTPQSERDVLGVAFQHMVANLRALVTELQQGSQHLASASSEISAMTTQHASGAHEQSAAIAQTTATVAQVKASADHAVQMAGTVAETAKHASGIAVEGVAAVAHATAGMGDIRQRVQSIAENILALSEQSQQIGDIIATVNDLADQSNLLALNAAIEASRAGEQGKGFTVVATEIRTLAEGSKAATAQVRTILSDIQRATNAAVMATEQGTKGVDAGSRLIEDAGLTIDALAEAIRHAAQSATQIAASVTQHSVGMEQIAVAMTDINQATSQSLAATKNTEQAAHHLTGLADRLSTMVVHYHL
jgi:methyl-accepting chemotaxis protein